MAPTDQKMKNKKFTAKEGNWKKSTNNAQGVKKKRKWVPEHKMFEGNLKEGQGFAFKRKEKVRHEYNRFLRREKKGKPESNTLYKEEYPEHLRHLYMAEAEKLKQEAWTNRLNRSKKRMKGQEGAGGDAPAQVEAAPAQVEAAELDPDVTDGPEKTEDVAGESVPTAERESLPMSNRMRKKLLKKTSYQKTKEEFEAAQEKRRKKKEEYLKNKQQKEEAIQKYKQKKMETYQILSKKTKKGQPNLNLQMEYLLQKIQGSGK